MGPVGSDGKPLGFTCTDVGGNALLVWNASQLTSDISVTGQIKTVNFYPGNFSVNGKFTSDGSLAFVGGLITINGSITASSVLLAGVSTSEAEISSTLLGPAPSRLVSASTSRITINPSAKITATSDNVIIAGRFVSNAGMIEASKGKVVATTGTRLDIGWHDIIWMEGAYDGSSATDYRIRNTGSIKATNIELEAQRSGNFTTISNLGKLDATDSITLVTGRPAIDRGDGTFAGSSFGVTNLGKIAAAKITISPFYPAVPGGTPKDRTFILSDAAQRQEARTYLGGAVDLIHDNTPTSAVAPVIDVGNTFTVTSSIVVPQLTPSMSHLNATSGAVAPVLVVAKAGTEQVRGENAKPAAPKPKPRSKAKPVLVRGAFFDSKISAVLSSNP